MNGWVDAATVAEYLSVERAWVYAHASELGARQLGNGGRARLRFTLAAVEDYLSICSAGRQSEMPESARREVSRPRKHECLGTNVALLPIRGRILVEEPS